MKKIQIYLMPIIVIAMLLLIAGCSGGGEQPDPNEIPVNPGTTNPIDCLFGEGEDCEVVEPECEGEDCEVVEPECEGEDCEEEPGGIVAPLRLGTYHSKRFDDAKFGESYVSRTKLVASGGIEPYVFTATGLPDGMTFNSDSKTVEGVPTKIGRFPTIFTVTDADGVPKTLEKEIVVKDDYTVEIRYKEKEISGAIEELEDEVIPFDERSLSAHIVNGHGAAYEWTIEIDSEELQGKIGDDSKNILFELPDTEPENDRRFEVKVSVVDESGHEENQSYEVTRALDLCTVPLELSAVGYDGMDGLGGVKISVTGGKGDYEFKVSLDNTIALYDLDGEELPDGTGYFLYDRKESTEADIDNAREMLGALFLLLSEGEDASGDYTVDVLNIPPVLSISGYELSGSVEVVDNQCEKSWESSFSVKKVQTMDTLDNLKMVCDFEDIHDAGGYNPYLEFDLYTSDGHVARAHYSLQPCNGNERSCEGEYEFKGAEDGEDDDGDPKYFDLSQIELNDVINIKLRKHKNRNGSTGGGDHGKLDVDLQWCRFYTEDNRWFAVWDDQKHGDDLNNNEVGGNKHWYKNDSTRKYFIMDRFEGYAETGNIWFMGSMLERVAALSPDGFDYETMRDNDCSDGDHDWCD